MKVLDQEQLLLKTGLNPITLEKMDITSWLDQDKENIAFYVCFHPTTTYAYILLKKSYLLVPEMNNILLNCVLNNKHLDVEQSYKNKDLYRNIGYFFKANVIVNNKQFTKILNSLHRIFTVTITNDSFKVISLEFLQLSTIGLRLNNKMDKEEKKKEKKNIPYKTDVYFDEYLADSLYAYSFQWDQPINSYLRFGESYFDTTKFNTYRHRYGSTQEEAIQAIKDKINFIDKTFLEDAPRVSSAKQIELYRGMKEQYTFKRITDGKRVPIQKVNDRFIGNNYMSLTRDQNIARSFSGVHLNNCCLYKIIPDVGIPYIDMVNTTKFKKEKEILLPRKLVYTVIDIIPLKKESIFAAYPGETYNMYVLKASPIRKDQFKIKNGCVSYRLANIEPYTSPSNSSNKLMLTEKQGEKVPVLDTKVNKYNRCPKGTRRNKKNGLCEAVTVKTDKLNNTTRKNSRCPNGTRRNKKTGNCDPK